MRTICDVCESAPAILFCAADEAALCRSCDDKVHKCNKLASRHVRVGLADPSDVPVCDICENAPAFFYCEIDGSSLCLQCDTVVHVGGKQTHKRYLLLRQRVEFPVDKLRNDEDTALPALEPMGNRKEQMMPKSLVKERLHRGNLDEQAIDLNSRPLQTQGQASAHRARGVHVIGGNSHQNGTVIPVGSLRGDLDK